MLPRSRELAVLDARDSALIPPPSTPWGGWTLMTLCYNLKRVLNLVSSAELMAAVKAGAVQPA